MRHGLGRNAGGNKRREARRLARLSSFFVIGVLFGCFGRKIEGDSWFTWWFNHLPGNPSIFQKATYVRRTCLRFFSPMR